MALQPETKALINENLKQYNLPFLNEELYAALQENPIYRSVDTSGTQGGMFNFDFIPLEEQHPGLQRRLGELYDPTLSYNMERVAQDQSAFERWAKMFPRIATKVASEVAQIPGYVGGLIDWATTGFDPEEIGRMVDNWWIQGVQEAEKAAKESGFMDIYVPKAVQQGGLMRNLASASFWATEGADAVGFLLAMLVPGQVAKFLGVGKGIAKLGETVGRAVLPKLVKPASLVNKTVIGIIDDVMATMLNTVYESGAEAGEAYRNILEDTGDKEIAGQAAAQTFRSNMLILLGPNYLQQKWLLNRFTKGRALGLPTQKQVWDKAVTGLIDPATGAPVKELAKITPWTKLSRGGEKALAGIFSEGFWEEGSQFATQEYAKEKAMAGEDDGNIIEDIIGTAESYFDSLSDTDFKKSVFLGGFMGAIMGGIGGMREVSQYKKMLEGTAGKKRSKFEKFLGLEDIKETPGLYKIWGEKYLDAYTSYLDLMEKDPETGKLIIKDGKMVPDAAKINTYTFERLQDIYGRQQMAQALATSNEEAFEYHYSKWLFNFMLPVLSQPGGLEVMKAQVNHLAQRDVEFFKEKYNLDLNVEDLKAGLSKRIDDYYKIIERINDTHDPNFNIKYDKKDKGLFYDFSDYTRKRKLSRAGLQYHHSMRIGELRDRLSSYKRGSETVSVTSGETKPGEKMISELKDSLSEQITKLNLGENDINLLKGYIDKIEKHGKALDKSIKEEKKLYNNKIQQQEFNDYVKKIKDIKDTGKKVEEKLIKEGTATGLHEALLPVYNELAKVEKVTANGQDFDVRYTGELTVNYIDENGEVKHEVFTLPQLDTTKPIYTSRGSLVLKTKDSNVIGNYLNPPDADNPNGTIYLKGKTYKLWDQKPYYISKEVTSVVEEFNVNSLVAAMEEVVSFHNNELTPILNEIDRIQGNLNELQEKIKKLQQKENESLKTIGTRLTKKGTERKELVKLVSSIGDSVVKQYMTLKEMEAEQAKLNEKVAEISQKRDTRLERLAELEDYKKSVAERLEPYVEGLRPIQIVEELISYVSEQIGIINNSLSTAQDTLVSTADYIKKLKTLLKGYNTTIARLLSVGDELNDIRINSGLTGDQLVEAEWRLLSDTIDRQRKYISERDLLNPNRFAEIENVLINKANIEAKITASETEIGETLKYNEKLKTNLEGYQKALSTNEDIRKRFYNKYISMLMKAGMAKPVVDKDTGRQPFEPALKDFDKDFYDFGNKDYEPDPHHPFDGTLKSWFITQGSQANIIDYNDDSKRGEHLRKLYTPKDIKDMIRWRIFINDHAYRRFFSGPLANKSRYVLHNYSYDIVSNLPEDNIIRKNLKFWAGEGVGFKTYDELQTLGKEAITAAKEDIKVVAFERVVVNKNDVISKVLTSDENGEEIAEGKEGSIFFTSFPTPQEKTTGNFDRFSTKKLWEVEAWKLRRELKAAKLNDEQVKEVNKRVKDIFDKSIDEYNKRREVLKKTSEVFQINAVTPGVQVYEGVEHLGVVEATGVEAKNLFLKLISVKEKAWKQTVDRTASGSRFGLKNGYLYVIYKNRYVVVKPKSLEETGSVDNILNLFRYLAQATDKAEFTAVETFLRRALYFSNANTDLRIAIERQFEEGKKVKDSMSKILFGKEGVVTKEQLSKGEGLEGFKEFLKTKWWNFDKESLANEKSTFTETMAKEVEGKIVLDSRTWSIADGGYKGFLFNTKKGNSSKGTVYLRPKAETPLKEIMEPQFMNQALKLSPIDDKAFSISYEPSDTQVKDKYNPWTGRYEKHEDDKIPTVSDYMMHGGDAKKVEYLLKVGYLRPDEETKKEAEKKEAVKKEASSELTPEQQSLSDAFFSNSSSSDTTTRNVTTGKKELTPEQKKQSEGLFGKKPEETTVKKEEKTPKVGVSDIPTGGKMSADDLLKKEVKTSKPEINYNKQWFATKEESWDWFLNNKKDLADSILKTSKDLADAQETLFNLGLRKFQEGIDIRKRGSSNRIADMSRQYELINLETAVQWLHEKFPEFSAHTIANLIDGSNWGQFRNGSLILLSGLAEVGTEYHEGFHIITGYFTTLEERLGLYDEVRKRVDISTRQEEINKNWGTLNEVTKSEWLDDVKGNETLAKENAYIEELLAEEFRTYMMSPKDYKFDKSKKVQQTFFQKILNLLKHFVERFFGVSFDEPNEIEAFFKRADNGKFLLKDRVSSTSKTFNRIEGFTEPQSLAYVKDITIRFFDKIFNNKQEINIHKIMELSKPEIYNSIYDSIKNDYQRELEVMKSIEGADYTGTEANIINKWKEIVEEHKNFMLQYNLDLREDPDDESEDSYEKVKDTYHHYSSNLVSPKDTIPKPVRLVIASLPAVTENGSRVITDFGTNSVVAYDRIINYLKNSLSTIDTFQGMIFKLKDLAARKPELRVLLDRLGIPEDYGNSDMSVTEFISYAGETKLHLQTEFYTAFCNNKNDPKLMFYGGGGRKIFLNPASDSETDQIALEWRNAARNLVGGKIIYKKGNDYYIRNKSVIAALKYIKSMDQTDTITRDRNKLKVLKELGITVSTFEADVRDMGPIDDYLDRLFENIVLAEEDITLNNLYDRDVMEFQKEADALIEYAASLRINEESLSFFNHDNKSEYSITLNSYLSNVKNRLNDIDPDVLDEDGNMYIPPSIEYLMPFDGNKGSFFNTHCKILNDFILQRDGKKRNALKLVLLRGAKTSLDRGYDTSRLPIGDYRAMIFNAILENTVPILQLETRKLAYAIQAFGTDWGITNSKYVSDSIDYLKDELITSFARILDEDFGGQLVHYKNNVKGLRSFDYLYEGKHKLPTLEDFAKINTTITKDKVPKSSAELFEEVTRLADKFVKDHESYIRKATSAYFDKNIDLNLQSLEEAGVVYKTGIGRYAIPGIDTKILKDAKIEPTSNDLITEDEMHYLVKVATYNYFVGAQEQLKLFFGDLAMYANADIFHKRTTGAGSTKYNSRNDTLWVEILNELYPKLDGTSYDYVIQKAMVAEVISKVHAKEGDPLYEISKLYGSIKAGDSQSWATLDGFRDIKLRKGGEWYNEHERTYQYEMQLLALEVMKDPELKAIFNIDESQFTEKGGVFYKHTGGKVPEAPMFNGKVINLIDKLMPLPPIKPQGFGNIGNIEGLSPIQYYKMSISPILPSIFIQSGNKNGLKMLLQLMNKGDGLLCFPEAEKITRIEPEGGLKNIYGEAVAANKFPVVDVIDDSVPEQPMSFDNFGIQLDIHDTTPNLRARVAIQLPRMTFLNMFDVGGVAEGVKLPEYFNEYNTVSKEITNRDMREAVDEFGLTVTKEGEYKLTDPKAFADNINQLYVKRLFPFNVTDGIKMVLESEDTEEKPFKIFDVLANKNSIYQVLLAYVRDRVIRRKSAGDMLILESPIIYGEELRFYQEGKDGTWAMEVMVSLPEKLIYFVEKVGGLAKFNEMIQAFRGGRRDEAKIASIKAKYGDIEDLLNISGVRIPVNKLGSIDAMHIAKFLPFHAGARMVVPSELTIKAGCDFDVDKMTTYFKNFTFYKNKITYRKYLTEENSNVEERLKTYAEYELASTLGDTYLNMPGGEETEREELRDAKINVLRKKGFGSWPIERQNITPALENRWNEITQQALLELGRFKDLVSPVETAEFKKIAEHIKNKKVKSELQSVENADNWNKVTQMWYNNAKAWEFWLTKHMVGLAAVQNTSHAIHQIAPVRVLDPLAKVFFDEQYVEDESGDVLISGHMYDGEGRLVSDNNSEFLSGYVDAGKDPFIVWLNADVRNFNAYSFLNRWGKETGVGISTIASLFTHEVSSKLTEEMDINNSMLLDANQYKYSTTKIGDLNLRRLKKSLNQIVNGMLNEFHAKKIYGMKNYQDMLFYTYQQYLNAEPGDAKEGAAEEVRKKLKKLDYQPLSKKILERKLDNDDESNKLRIQILDNILMYRIYGQQLARLNMVTRPDAGLEDSLSSLDSKSIMLSEMLNNGFFNPEDIVGIFDKTYIGAFQNVKEATRRMFSWGSLVRKSPEINDFFIENFTKPFTKNIWDEQKRNRVLKYIEDEFITFLVTTIGTTTEAIRNNYKEILMGPNSVPKQISKAKNPANKKNKDKMILNSTMLREFEPVINEFDTVAKEDSEIDYLTTFNRALNVFNQNSITSDWLDLIQHHPNPVIKDFFRTKVILQAIYQGGFKSYPHSIMKLVPNGVFINLAEARIKQFLELSPDVQEELMYTFKELMYRNAWNNRDLVPRQKGLGKGHRIDKKFEWYPKTLRSDNTDDFISPKEANHEFIARTYATTPKSTTAKIFASGKTPKMFTVLYKRKLEGNVVIFEEVGKFGDGKGFSEFYPVSTETITSGILKSILKRNTTEPVREFGVAEETSLPTPPQGSPSMTDSDLSYDVTDEGSFASDEKLDKGKYNPPGAVKESGTVEKDGLKIANSITALYAKHGLLEVNVSDEYSNFKYIEGNPIFEKDKLTRKSKFEIAFKGLLETYPIGLGLSIEKLNAFTKFLRGTNDIQSAQSIEKILPLLKRYQFLKVETVANPSDVKAKEFVEINNKVLSISLPIINKYLSKLDLPLLKATKYFERRQKEMFSLDTLPRIKELLREVNREDLTKEQHQALSDELDNLLFTEPGQMISRAEKSAAREKLFSSLLRQTRIPADEKLDQLMKDFLTAIGVKYNSTAVIKNKFGKDVPEAVAVARISQMTIEYITERLDITKLPEEAAHFYVALLDKNDSLYKSMYNKIVNYPVYQLVKNQYSEVYEGDETMLREEAIGQLIAQKIVDIYNKKDNTELTQEQKNQSDNWFKALIAKIKAWFNKVFTNPYSASAYNIMNKRLVELTLENRPPADVNLEFFGTSKDWNELFADKTVGTVKYRYFRTYTEAEQYAEVMINNFGKGNVTILERKFGDYRGVVVVKNPDITQSNNQEVKKVVADKNYKEFRKEGEFTLGEQEIINNFEKYYPNYTHFDSVEREGFVRGLSVGEIEQVCGL